jgi:hypothetical protein
VSEGQVPANRRWCLNEQAFETTVMSFEAP